MKALYKPIGLILGILSGVVAKKLFDFVWTKIDDEPAPKGTTQEAPWAKILAAAALQGLIFKSTRVVVDRYGAVGWHYITGVWPGGKPPATPKASARNERLAWQAKPSSGSRTPARRASRARSRRRRSRARAAGRAAGRRPARPHPAAQDRRAGALLRLGEQVEQDRQLRLVLELAADHRERVGVEDREQLLVVQPEQLLQMLRPRAQNAFSCIRVSEC